MLVHVVVILVGVLVVKSVTDLVFFPLGADSSGLSGGVDRGLSGGAHIGGDVFSGFGGVDGISEYSSGKSE